MKGIKITGKETVKGSGDKSFLSILDFGFPDILEKIEDYISELYWAHTGIIYSFPNSLTKEEYGKLNNSLEQYILHNDQEKSIQYMHRGFIENFGQYIFSDTLEITGYENIENLRTFDLDNLEIIDENAEVYIRCKDVEYWEVFARNEEVLKVIEQNFQFTESLSLY